MSTLICTTGFILLILAGCQTATAQSQKPAQQQQAASDSQPSVSATPSQGAIQQPEAGVESGKGQQEQERDQSTFTDWIQVGINGALFVIIVLQTAIYWQQRKIMQRQIEQAKVSERAYIGIKGVHTENQALGKLPNVRVTMVNGGRTPAWGVKFPATLSLGTEFPHERPETDTKGSPTFLPAGGETVVNYPFPFVLTPQWVAHFRQKQWTVFLHIEAHFEDCWGEKQVTPFKLAYRPDSDRWGDYKEKRDPEVEWTMS